MMEHELDGGRGLTLAVRWTARAWTVVTISVVVLLSLGEGVHPAGPAELIGLVLYPGGICAGMILAWWKEGLGGGVTVVSLAAFYILYTLTKGDLPPGWAWLILATPGFLFLWCSRRSRRAGAAVA